MVVWAQAAQVATMHMVMPMRGLPRGRSPVLPAAC
jgi:hypothetical protein